MKPTLNDETPIFLQIADMIKDDLVEGLLSEGEQIPSTTELSNFYNINRATAQKVLHCWLMKVLLLRREVLVYL